jgi:hypothetical protein
MTPHVTATCTPDIRPFNADAVAPAHSSIDAPTASATWAGITGQRSGCGRFINPEFTAIWAAPGRS